MLAFWFIYIYLPNYLFTSDHLTFLTPHHSYTKKLHGWKTKTPGLRMRQTLQQFFLLTPLPLLLLLLLLQAEADCVGMWFFSVSPLSFFLLSLLSPFICLSSILCLDLVLFPYHARSLFLSIYRAVCCSVFSSSLPLLPPLLSHDYYLLYSTMTITYLLSLQLLQQQQLLLPLHSPTEYQLDSSRFQIQYV